MAKLIVKKGDPPVTVKEVTRTKTPADDTADIRDSITYLVGQGGALGNDDARATFGLLQNKMGVDKARKLMDAITIHSQRPEVLKMNPEQRISSFYDIGSSNADISPYIQKAKTFGQGVLAGLNSSPLVGNMILSGREKPIVAATNPDTELAKKIMLRVGKK